MMKPNTRFLTHYLAAVGSLAVIARDVDLDYAARKMAKAIANPAARAVFLSKETLLLRPMRMILADPHALAGFIGRYGGALWRVSDGEVRFTANPIRFLSELYHYLHMDHAPEKPACVMIWPHDDEVLRDARAFYERVARLTGVDDWEETQALFEKDGNDAIAPDDPELWAACQAAHRGYQLGMEILLLLPRIGVQSGFLDITVNELFEPVFPEQYHDPEVTKELIRALAPPPSQSANEIVTPMGGSFYAREAPHLDPLVNEGDHFDEGQPLFIIEVMKMFNKVLAPFAGTLTVNHMVGSDGAVVAKGQTIFEIEPDEVVIEETEEEIAKRRQSVTGELLG